MAGAMRKAMLYLGLTDDDRYDSYEGDGDGDGREQADPGQRDQRERPRVAESVGRESGAATTATASRGSTAPLRGVEPDSDRRAEVTQLPRRTPVAQVVNDVEVSGVHRITTIHPRTYNEAKTIGENFRDGTPVIMNLTDLDDGDAKRLVDFAAGLVFGLQGSIERVTNKVFLLSPADVEVTSEGGEPVQGRGLFNQS